MLAAAAKVYEPGAFVEQIRLEGLDFLLPAVPIALLALALETGLGLALLLGVHHRAILVASGLLAAFFLFLTGRNYWLVSQGLRDPEASCGCFGSLIERTPAEAFWQDLALLVPPLLLLFWLTWLQRQPFPRVRTGLSIAAAVLVAVGTWFSPALKFSEAAAAIAAVETDRTFRPTQTFALEVDDRPDATAQILESEGEVGVLILAQSLPGPALVDPRSNRVQLLNPAQVQAGGEGEHHLAEPIQELRTIEFQIVAGAIQFEVEGRAYRLVTL